MKKLHSFDLYLDILNKNSKFIDKLAGEEIMGWKILNDHHGDYWSHNVGGLRGEFWDWVEDVHCWKPHENLEHLEQCKESLSLEVLKKYNTKLILDGMKISIKLYYMLLFTIGEEKLRERLNENI